MKTIILDTSFIIDLIKFKINLEEISSIINEPYRLITVDSVIRELEKLSKRNKNALAALRFLKKERIEIVSIEASSADSAILHLANKDIIVATDDRKLRKELRRKRIQTIYVRGKKYLGIS